MNKSQLIATLEQRRKELRLLDQLYQKSKHNIESDEGKVHRTDLTSELFSLLSGFAEGDSGEKAIYILAIASRLAKQLNRPLEIIREYEQKRKTVDDLQKMIDET